MTATYDGHLRIERDSPKVNRRHIEPCCEDMAKLIFARVVYLGTGSRLRIRTAERDGIDMSVCPCCGAHAEVGE